MRILVVEPQKPCRVQEIENLTDMQQLVGGDIEAVYPFQEPVAVVCNADGKALGLPMNRPLLDEAQLPYDIICGTFFLAGLGKEDFISLTEEQIRRYKGLYDNTMVMTMEKELRSHKPGYGAVNAEKPMTNYTLTSVGAVSASAELAHIRTNQEPDQSSYNAAWLHGYADALTNVADALEPQQKLMDAILCYVAEQYDSSELYNILHDTLAMSDQDIVSLGFDLPQCHKHNEEISTKRPKERKSTSYER